MITKNFGTLTLKGKSGKEYNFIIHKYDAFVDVKDGFTGHGLYLFGKYTAETNKVKYIYLGMASSLTTRFDSHHKEGCIKRMVQTV